MRTKDEKRVAELEAEIARLKGVVGALLTEKDARSQGLERMQQDMSKHIAAAAQWEARFDLLLRIASGEAANAARWSEVVAKMAKWTE